MIPSVPMRMTGITPDNAEFLLLSFEGPDLYSMAGGLGVRVTNLSETLTILGFPVHLVFIGDPKRRGLETRNGGKLVLHRWCQWLSEYFPYGVYEGENEKIRDFNESVPPFVLEHIAEPAIARDKVLIVLGEEWQTAEAMCRLSDAMQEKGIRNRAVMFWNANNTFSFDRIDWARLSRAATITTVSKYMKHIMRGMGLDPLVIPNGIPISLLNKVDEESTTKLRKTLAADLVLSKVARWDPDKRWLMAVEAVAGLKARGLRTTLIARGGIESHGAEVMARARSLGLSIADIHADGDGLEHYLQALAAQQGADVLNIRFHCPQEFLRVVYHASDAVLANSGHEPFGLVGLEAMAAEGIAFTGGTGEDYAMPLHNAIVLETADPAEIEGWLIYLEERPWEKSRIRKAARETAALYTWQAVIDNLVHQIEYQAAEQGLLELRRLVPVPGAPWGPDELVAAPEAGLGCRDESGAPGRRVIRKGG